MESITILHLLVFSAVAYLLGYTAGRKTGFIKAIRSIPVTILEISEELHISERDQEDN
jgi:hypothetical protein